MRILAVAALVLAATPAFAGDCPGNPDALGISRTLVVDPAEHPRIGSFQYPHTLPLADKEVVLTFDDAPRPVYTAKVLDILKENCLKATYFLIGAHAKEFPDMVRRIHAEGHTLASHSQRHPLSFNRMSVERIDREVQTGIASIKAALGDEGDVAPFFRIPGLLRSDRVERYLADKGLMLWSTDVMAHDWKRRINVEGIVRRTIDRLNAKGKGILLLHDVHERTAAALPMILKELKERGYRIVHVVPATADRPKTPTEPDAWEFTPPEKAPLPALLAGDINRLNDTFAEQRHMSPVDLCGETPIMSSRKRLKSSHASSRRYRKRARKYSR